MAPEQVKHLIIAVLGAISLLLMAAFAYSLMSKKPQAKTACYMPIEELDKRLLDPR